MLRMSRRRPLGHGSSAVLFFGSSLPKLLRSQPPWTKVSLPSERTSLIVTWRSMIFFGDLTHARSAPAPMTTVFWVNGSVTKEAAVPFGSRSHLYGGVVVHRPSL